MRITNIEEKTISVASDIRNAYINFGSMSASVVVLYTDIVRDGKRVTGYGFSSNGRYAQGGILRERIIPRILGAKPKSLLNESQDNLDPFLVWETMMRNEKPGGHGDRSVAVGAIDMAVWDVVAKTEGKPLFACLPNATMVGEPMIRFLSMLRGVTTIRAKALKNSRMKYVAI
jgi:L-alanine-DL-glutamate epimerase-like enolase superfamily enzyme